MTIEQVAKIADIILVFLAAVIVAWFGYRQAKIGYNKTKADKNAEKVEELSETLDKTEKDQIKDQIAECYGSIVTVTGKVESLEGDIRTLAEVVNRAFDGINQKLNHQETTIQALVASMKQYSEDGRVMMNQVSRTTRLAERLSKLESINMEYTKSVGSIVTDVSLSMMEYISDPGTKAQFEKTINAHKHADEKLVKEIMEASSAETPMNNTDLFQPPELPST